MSSRILKLLVYAAVLVLVVTWRMAGTPLALPHSPPLSASSPKQAHAPDQPADADDEDFSLTQVFASLEEDSVDSMDGMLLAAIIVRNTTHIFLPAILR